jgi:aminopeptidase YwaD
VANGERHVSLVQGRDMVALEAPEALAAPMIVLHDTQVAADAVKGKMVVYDSAFFDLPGVQLLLRMGAVAVISPASEQIYEHWAEFAARPPGRTQVVGVARRPSLQTGLSIFAKAEGMAALRALGEGQAKLEAPRGEPRSRTTYNVVGVLHGRAVDADRHALLLTAHYDHLGVRNGVIFHGANDDASGTAAVLEFARILGGATRHRRTVYFGLFGCEEEGALGAQYVLARPPMAIGDLVANLEFEMIGVDDPKRPGALMLTGWERSNLGPTLAAHGARIGPDLYPTQNFFQRSDNYQLALRGVVAQTISAWPVPPTYHAASDDLAHVDLAFMDQVIGSMVAPVDWLLDSDFQPAWNAGQKP